MKKNIKLFTVIAMLLVICGCSSKKVEVNSIEDLKDEKVGVFTGSEYDQILEEKIPEATAVYYNSYNDQISSLKSNKIAAFLTDEPLAKEILKNHDDLKILDEKLTEDSYAFAISKNNEELKNKIDSVLQEMEEDKTLEKFQDKWFNYDKDTKLEEYDYDSSKTIKFATVSGSAPFAFMMNNEIVGYDIEVIKYIGYKLNYNVEIVEMAFEGIIPALISNKVDVAGCSIIVTEQRKQSVLFSIPDYTGGIVVVTNK